MSYNPFEEKRRTDTINLLRKENSHLLSENTLISKKLKDVEYENRLLGDAVKFLESSKPKWIKIESEKDLPKGAIECYVFDDDGDIGYYTFNLIDKDDWEYVKNNGVTHYMPMIKPDPPKED